MNSIENRYEVIALVEARMCNPNGDPDMANRPRVDMETNRGIITDVAFKARMREYVLNAYSDKSGCEILIQNGASINKAIAEAVLEANGTDKLKDDNKKVDESAAIMCARYWDVRTFGAVLSTGLNAGQIRGAAQVGMSLSVDPIETNVMSLTRRCYTEGKYKTISEYVSADAKMKDDKKRTFGDKAYTPYGLYVFKMTISANLAQKVGFSEEDLKILLEALVSMYDDASASKMGMSVLSPVIVFKHVGHNTGNADEIAREKKLGCAPAYKLFDLLTVVKKNDVNAARAYTDYDIQLDLSKLPDGVICGAKYDAFSDIEWFDTRESICIMNT